jgi:hypothetical protein
MPRSRFIGALAVVLLVATACAKVLGIKDAQLESTTCGYSSSDNCTQACIENSCCSEASACMNDSDCSDMVTCANDCGSDDEVCLTDCISSYPSAWSTFMTMSDCVSGCGCSTTGVGGATGTGGASGRGGSSPLGGSSATAVGGSAVNLDAAIQSFAAADCAKYQACAPGWLALTYGGLPECVNRDLLQYRWIAQQSGVAWQAANYAACATALTQASCADYFSFTALPACSVPGTLANYASCNTGFQCASQFCDTDGLSCGECIDPPLEGEYCASWSCGAGLTCADDGTCQRRRALGESCTANLPCQSLLDCYQGRCVAPLASVGAACDSSVGPYCDYAKSFVCATSTKKCVSITSWALPGQACGVDSTTSTAASCNQGYCGTGQTCIADAKDHMACDSDVGPYCEWPAFCSSGTCHLESDVAVCK